MWIRCACFAFFCGKNLPTVLLLLYHSAIYFVNWLRIANY